MDHTEFIVKAMSGEGIKWVEKGRDFGAWDCWGLVVCYYQEVLGINLDNYDCVACSKNATTALRTMLAEAARWEKIESGQEKLGDVVLWRPLHAGLVIGQSKMLHCQPGCETVIERYNNMLWRDIIIGFYRYAG